MEWEYEDRRLVKRLIYIVIIAKDLMQKKRSMTELALKIEFRESAFTN